MSSSDDVIEVIQIKSGGNRRKILQSSSSTKDAASSSSAGSTSGLGSGDSSGVKARLLIRKGKNGGNVSGSGHSGSSGGTRVKGCLQSSSRESLKSTKKKKSVSYSSQLGQDDYDCRYSDDGGIDNVLMRQQQQQFGAAASTDSTAIMKSRRGDCVEWRRHHHQPGQPAEVDNNIKRIRAKVTTLDEILKSQQQSNPVTSLSTVADRGDGGFSGVSQQPGYPITTITPATPLSSSYEAVVGTGAVTFGRCQSASSFPVSSANKIPSVRPKPKQQHYNESKAASSALAVRMSKSGSNSILPEPYPSCSKSTTPPTASAAASGNYHKSSPLHYQPQLQHVQQHEPCSSSNNGKWKSDTSGIMSGDETMSDGGDYTSGSEPCVEGEGDSSPSGGNNCCDCTCWCCGCQGSSSCSRRTRRQKNESRLHHHHQSHHNRLNRRSSSGSRVFRWRDCWSQLIKRMPSCFHSLLGLIAKIYWRLVDGIFGIEPPYRDHNGEETERRIRANDPVFNSRFNYANNLIKTSKYTVLTFLPLNLFEQFQRLANFYFLCLLVLQVIPVISSLTPLTTAVPLFLVLALTAIKDAYDDFQRHRSDSQVNNRKSLVLRHGLLQEERWHKVQVGDVIRMENDQFVAADVLLLSSSEPNGLTFIETAELDGETNLKCRQCLMETADMGQEPEKLGSFDGDIVCEPPNNHLNKFEGTLTWRGKKYPLDNDKILLRGCILRNTQWCYGVVIFAGRDTKLMQNSGKTKFKRTSIDRLLNFIILGIVFFLLSMCLFCTIACAFWETMIGQYFRIYLPWDSLIPDPAVEGAVIISLLAFFSYAIILNTVVPISLYVSVEVIRLMQSFLINWDLKMYHEATDTPAKARTTTLNEELGQIEYIFSDKTGTLTQNIMTFNKCTIAGKSYGEVIDPQTGEVVEHLDTSDGSGKMGDKAGGDASSWIPGGGGGGGGGGDELVEHNCTDAKKTENSILCGSECGCSSEPESHQLLLHDQPASTLSTISTTASITTTTTTTTTTATVSAEQKHHHNIAPIDFSDNPHYEPKFKFYDRTLLDAVKNGDQDVHMFFRHLALCHTVMAEERNGNLEYQAQSPDENALVSAARNFGFVFKERSPDSITISIMGKVEVYDLLCILDFNNVRKRMSVVVQRDERILLLCKGADSIIYERLVMGSDDVKSRTQEHLNKFAGEGLRTLVLAVKVLTPEYFDDWKRRHHEAAVSVHNREEKLDAIYEEIERDMTLIGATAIEDKLQDGVPTCIANLMLAGIKIWVLTGDKQETAINIGYSCQLLTDEMNDIFIVDGSSFEDVKAQLLKYLDAVQTGSCAPLDNQRMGDVSMVTFSESEYGPGYHPGDGDSSNDHETNGGYAVIVNGHSLVHALHPQLEGVYLELASQCKAVICCRVTPLQKALVVELVKKYKKAVTLAIGDGANDVSMIKTAHIGVGVSGQEGQQAVLASDYSIAQFRYLERLLLVHGRWSYYRMAKFLRYFFYKNFAFTLSHFWYAFFCGFSAQTVFDPMFISVYNLFYTSAPVLAIGIFDQDCNDEYSLRYPKLYTPGHRNLLFNKKEFFKSALHGFVTSCVLFIVPYGTYNHAITADGQGISDHMLFGSVVSTILVVVVTAQVALDTSYWTVFNHVTIWCSLLNFFVFHYVYNFIVQGKYLGSLTKALQEASFWFTLVLTVMILIIPVLAWRFYFHDVHPTLSDRVRLKQRVSSAKTRMAGDKAFRTPSARRSRRSLRSSYAFAHQEGFGPLITSGKIMRKAKSNNNHAAGSTVASLVSSVTSFGVGNANNSGAMASSLSKSPRITMVTPQDPKHYQDSVRL